MTSVTIFGARGMVGIEVLHACLDEPRVTKVVSVGRRPTGVSHAKLREVMHTDFTNLAPIADELRTTDLIVYCVGVYTGRVPDDEFTKITCDYFAALLSLLKQINSHATVCLFSAQGADPTEKSRLIFARAKGRAERMLAESSVKTKYVFRPGYIAPGRRKGRGKIPDWLAYPVFRVIPALGVTAVDLARVMLYTGLDGSTLTLFENADIRRAAKKLKSRA